MSVDDLHPESIVVAAGRPDGPGGPVSTPIVLTAPFRSATDGINRYGRAEVTDTVLAFEAALGALEGGTATAFGSGMAAVSAVADAAGRHGAVVLPAAAYSGTVTVFDAAERAGRDVRRVDIADTAAVLAALDGAGLVWLETVTNPLLAVPDLPAISAAAHEAGALVCVDATFSTPLVARPLDLGADVVVHSVTKYLSGHSDVLMGAVVTRTPELDEGVRDRRTYGGAVPGALEAFLATRGLRTLALRMERAQANAATLAARLAGHPAVVAVRYPGLPGDPGHAVAARDHRGFGAVVGFELADAAAADRLCAGVRLITHATSLGGVESLVERRASHEVDARVGTPPGYLRLSVGVEHVDDLWADLQQALPR